MINLSLHNHSSFFAAPKCCSNAHKPGAISVPFLAPMWSHSFKFLQVYEEISFQYVIMLLIAILTFNILSCTVKVDLRILITVTFIKPHFVQELFYIKQMCHSLGGAGCSHRLFLIFLTFSTHSSSSLHFGRSTPHQNLCYRNLSAHLHHP